MSPSTIVRQAADLISAQQNWTPHFTARGPIIVAGRQTDPGKDACCLATDKHAVQFSALGAIFRIGRKAKLSNKDCYDLERSVCRELGIDRLSDWNARTDHKEVVAGLRLAADGLDSAA